MSIIDKLDKFTRAYIECALWSSTDNSREDGGDPLDANYSIDDVEPEALARMVADCGKFQRENAVLLNTAYMIEKDDADYDESSAGHDFWLTRNGHGAGFWDRGLGGIGDALTRASKPYGACDLVVEDDGKIYVS